MISKLFDGGISFKTKHRHRGMRLDVALYSPDDWGRQLAAGGDGGSRTPVRKPLDTTFFGCSLLFKIPLICRQQTDFKFG